MAYVGPCSYGLCRVMAYVVMAYVVMAYVVISDSVTITYQPLRPNDTDAGAIIAP